MLDEEDLYDDDLNNQEESDEYTSDTSSFNIEDTQDFKAVLLKI